MADQDQERLLEVLRRVLEGGKDARDDQTVEAAHPSDVAAILQHLPLEQQVALLRRLPAERAGEVLPSLDDTTLLTLVQALDEVEVSRILDEMPPEHAADVVEELPREEAEKILELMEEEHSEDVQEILEYPEHSAGRLMSPDFVAVREDATVEEAIKHIRDSVAVERAFELYVVDSHRHLVGTVPLRRLLIAGPATAVLAIRDENVVSVPTGMDQEEVARVVAKYDLVAVAVVDAHHRLVGTITADDVVDIVGEEATEDIFRMAGSDAAELQRRTPQQIAVIRLPWGMATLRIQLGAGAGLHSFGQTPGKGFPPASFMPRIPAIPR